MPTYDTVIDNVYKIGDIIGKQLIATGNVVAHLDHYFSKDIQLFQNGSPIGTVLNYYLEPGTANIYWYFKSPSGRSYFVLHNKNLMSLNAVDKATTKTVKDYIIEKNTESEKEQEGVMYYVYKVGKPILITAATLIGLKILYDGRSKG